MSIKPMDQDILHCDLAKQLRSRQDPIADGLLVSSLLEAQQVESVDELGDVIVGGDEFVRTCMQSAGVEMDFSRASMLAGAVASCLRQRYLGNCQSHSKCSGKDEMDRRIAAMQADRVALSEDTPESAGQPDTMNGESRKLSPSPAQKGFFVNRVQGSAIVRGDVDIDRVNSGVGMQVVYLPELERPAEEELQAPILPTESMQRISDWLGTRR